MRAFSLIELSIVLVILGLLTGGVLAGQSLIRAAELRSVITEAEQHQNSVRAFRDKYNALPGDMPDATNYWGSAGGTGANNTCFLAQTASSQAVCNGNDDRFIMGSSLDLYAERFSAWKHLSNAGIVQGNYSGRSTGAIGTYTQTVGTNVPAARIQNGFWDIASIPSGDDIVHYSASTVFPAHAIGIYGNTANCGVMTPDQAWNIDTKLDDGSPVYGNIVTIVRSAVCGGNCTTSNSASAAYDIQSSGKNCMLDFTFK